MSGATEWARWSGEHALAIYFVLLLLLLASAWVLWWSFQRLAVPREPGGVPLWWALGARLALGFGAIVAGASLFAEIGEEVAASARIGQADQALTDAVRHSVPQAALQMFALVTRLADTPTLVLLCIAVAVALVWRGKRWFAVGWVAAVAGNGMLNTTLKRVFERVRPLHDGGLVQADGFSFPSGHSSGSVVACGMLAYLALRLLPARWHLPAVLLAVAVAFTIGTSRIMLRVHFASDVIAGFASGTAWLAVCIASIELTRWYGKRRR